MKFNWLKLFFLFFFTCSINAKEISPPNYSLSFNALQTLVYASGNKLLFAKKEPKLIYLPIHFDGQMRLNDFLGLSFGLVYKFETYQDDGPPYSSNNHIRMKKIWTNFHEIFLLAGPRISPFDTGLSGFYVSTKAGVGTAFSPEYFSLSLLAQPDAGYAFCFQNPGFRLTLGLGVLLNLPLYETKDFAVLWKKNRPKFNAVGVIVHQITPVFNLGLGFNW